MKRILMMVFRNIIFVPYCWIKLCYRAAHADKYSAEDMYRFLKWICSKANKGGNVTIEAHGTENIPAKDGFIFFPNHQGLYDVLAVIETCPRPFAVVAKKELANIPFLKQIFACMKAEIIDREDVRQSLKVISTVAKETAQGRNFLIFAEGTRSKNGNRVGTFKGGSFKAATRARCPIVPVALVDSFKPFDQNTTKQVTVQIHYLKPLLYEEYKGLKTNEIAAEVEKQIQACIDNCIAQAVT